MAKDHYLPAAFIGRFSCDDRSGLPTRNRKVWIARVPREGAPTTRSVARCQASTIGYCRNLYDMPSRNLPEGARGQRESVDSWKYEPELPRVLDALCDGKTLSLSDWLHVAVPFVSSLFVRGIDFNERYESRLGDIGERIEEESPGWTTFNTNFARPIEMESLILPVMAATWTVHHAPLSVDVVTNNVGLIPCYDPRLRQPGWAIPLDPKTVLMLLPGSHRCFASHGNTGWAAVMEHLSQPPEFFAGLDKAAASSAPEFVIGPTSESASSISSQLYRKTPQQLAAMFEFDWKTKGGLSTVARDLALWARATAIADANITPLEIVQQKPFSWNDVDASRWTPTVHVMDDGTGAPNHTILLSEKNLYVKIG